MKTYQTPEIEVQPIGSMQILSGSPQSGSMTISPDGKPQTGARVPGKGIW